MFERVVLLAGIVGFFRTRRYEPLPTVFCNEGISSTEYFDRPHESELLRVFEAAVRDELVLLI